MRRAGPIPTPKMKSSSRFLAGVVALALGGLAPALAAAQQKEKVRLAPMPGISHLIPKLAEGLGYFEDEGLQIELVAVMDHQDVDWRSTELMENGMVDAEICWFHRVVFGIGNGKPAKAVVLLEDSPGMKILVANQVKGQIKSAADFKGRRVSSSAGFSTKRYLTEFVASRQGVRIQDINFLPEEFQSGQPAAKIVTAVKNGEADVLTVMDPTLIGVEASGTMTTLYDLTTREGTKQALGEVWPARCLYVSPAMLRERPATVQKLVNAFVRTKRFIDTHSVEEIWARLPLTYFDPHKSNHDWQEYRAAEKEKIRRALSTFTKGDYSVPPAAAAFATNLTMSAQFDQSGEGKYRLAAREGVKVVPAETYDNSFVQKAMKQFK